jgi:Leucine-rich repeat (LRR) protein
VTPKGANWWDKAIVSTIDASSNEIDDIPPELIRFQNGLVHLMLQHNKIASLQSLVPLEGLKVLNLASNRIESLDFSLLARVCPLLASLDISNNDTSGWLFDPAPVGRFDPRLSIFEKLAELNVSGNKQLPPTLLTELEAITPGLFSLNLDGCHLDGSHLPPSLGHVHWAKSLQILSVASMQLAEFPSHFPRNFLALTTLSCPQGICSHLTEEAFASHPSLTEVDLTFNRLTMVPPTILYGLPSLLTLRLDHNQLSTLPLPSPDAAQRASPRLLRLHLAHNNCREVTLALSLLPQLRNVILEGNPLLGPVRAAAQRGAAQLLAYLKTREPSALAASAAVEKDEAALSLFHRALDPQGALHFVHGGATRGNATTMITWKQLAACLPQIPQETLLRVHAVNWRGHDVDTPILDQLPVLFPALQQASWENCPCAPSGLIEAPVTPWMSLNILIAAGCRVSAVHLASLPNCHTLSLANNAGLLLADCTWPPALLSLSLASCGLDEAPAKHLPSTALTHLDLSGNNLRQIDLDIAVFPHLRGLLLAGNAIKSIQQHYIADGGPKLITLLKNRRG